MNRKAIDRATKMTEASRKLASPAASQRAAWIGAVLGMTLFAGYFLSAAPVRRWVEDADSGHTEYADLPVENPEYERRLKIWRSAYWPTTFATRWSPLRRAYLAWGTLWSVDSALRSEWEPSPFGTVRD